MFNVSFFELLLIVLLALILLGPERMLVLARTLGRWVRQGKSIMNNVKREFKAAVDDTDQPAQAHEQHAAKSQSQS